MSEKLKDPKLPAHAIIEEREDGSARRNDGMVLGAANKNPWYVLATVFGEQAEGATQLHHDEVLAAKNRRAWNGWICRNLGQKGQDDLAERMGINAAELRPLNEREMPAILACFRTRLGDDTAELPVEKSVGDNKHIDLSKLYFSTAVNFARYVFTEDCEFMDSHFSQPVMFNSTMFLRNMFFIEATFNSFADFRYATFKCSANFRSALFSEVAVFDSAIFQSNVEIQSATFLSGVSFESTEFKNKVDFGWYEYNGLGHDKAPYPTRFFGKVHFNDAKLKSVARFTDAVFDSFVPEFHGAELHDDTTFTLPDNFRDNWPPLSGTVKIEGDEEPLKVMPADQQKRAYNRLQLFMNKSMQIDEEQFFHRMEMRCKKEMADWLHTPIYWMFEKLSDFGISVMRPMAWLAVSIFVGWFVMMLYLGLGGRVADGSVFGESLGWSISNSIPLLGFGKLHYGAEYFKYFPVYLKILAGVQTLIGYILLFFLGLGLRNRFRLR